MFVAGGWSFVVADDHFADGGGWPFSAPPPMNPGSFKNSTLQYGMKNLYFLIHGQKYASNPGLYA